MGMAGRYFFVRENSYLLFQKNKEGKASDIRKIHGSHKTIPMERKCQGVKEYGKKMFSCYGGGNTGLSISAVADAGILKLLVFLG